MSLRVVKDAKQAIDILGGVVRVAEICGVGRNAVSNWYRRNIPARHYMHLAPRLRKAGCKFSDSLFQQKNGGET